MPCYNYRTLVYAILVQNYSVYPNRKRVFFTRSAVITLNAIEDLDSLELLPYSVDFDLVHSDYYLFHLMFHLVQKRQFNNQEEVSNGVFEFFGSKYKDMVSARSSRVSWWCPQAVQESGRGPILWGLRCNLLFFKYNFIVFLKGLCHPQ